MNNITTKVVGLVLGLAVFVLASEGAYQDEKQQEADYCKMVSVWEDERKAGVSPFDRAGYPPRTEEERQRCTKKH